MADYDRRILVPYLRDLCCTELLCRKLEQDIYYYRNEADKYAQWANQPYNDPQRPNPSDYSHGDDSAKGSMILGGGICLCGCLLFVVPFLGPFLGIAALFVGFILMRIGISEDNDSREIHNKQYEQALQAYNTQVANNKKYRESRAQWNETATRLRAKENQARRNLQNAKRLKDSLYAVNIIPSRYRTLHAVYYLYDYFETCRETDLDKIIQTMLLDEIVQRMDKLIAQNQQILLNQRIQIAQQERANRISAENHREQMRKIARMEANQERQLDYQRMIERNQEVTNFFLSADYINKRK